MGTDLTGIPSVNTLDPVALQAHIDSIPDEVMALMAEDVRAVLRRHAAKGSHSSSD